MSEPVSMALMAKAFATIGTYGSAITAATSVGTAALGYSQAKSAANAQEEQNNAANERARQYMIEDQDALTDRSSQDAAAASQKINQNQIDARKAAASTKVAATAGGVSGLSIDSLLGDIYGQEASIRDSVNQNLDATGRQLQRERGSVQRGYTNAVNTRRQPQHPSLLGTALEAGTGVVGAYKDQFKIQARLNKGDK